MPGSRAPPQVALAGLLLGVVLLLTGPGARAGEEAEQWLMRMAEAMRVQAYEGTLVYEHGDRLDAMEIVHGYIDGEEYERLRVLNGEPFEIIRQGDRVTCVWPATRELRVDQRPGDLFAPRPPRDLRSLPGQYRAQLGEETRVAGRGARVLRIHAGDRFRYGYRMWIDRRTGLLLRSDLLDVEGTVHERIMFTEIRPLSGVDRARFEPSLEGQQYRRHDGAPGASKRLADPAWAIGDLPPGFRLVSHRSEAMPPHGQAVQHSVFTDGLASVSVFVEPAETDAMPLRGLSRMGAIHAWGRTLEGHQITAVGEVPAATVRRIARSVHRAGEG